MQAAEMINADKVLALVDLVIDMHAEHGKTKSLYDMAIAECSKLRDQLSDAKENERALIRKCRVYESILDERGIDYSKEFGHE